MKTISRFPGMAGEANDAMSAYTQVHLSEAPRLLRKPEKERPEVWTTLPPRRRPKQWDTIEVPVVLLERNFFVHPLDGLQTKRKNVSTSECLCVHRKSQQLLSVSVDDIKKAGKKDKLGSMWNTLPQ